MNISYVHGDCKVYPTAAVYAEVTGQTYRLTLGLVANLAHQVILVQDIPVLQKLVQFCKAVRKFPEQMELTAWSELPYFESEIPVDTSLKVSKSRCRRIQEKMAGTVRVGLQELPDPEDVMLSWLWIFSNFKNRMRH